VRARLLGWVLLAFVVFFVATSPRNAATTAQHVGAGLGRIGEGLVAFVIGLTGGGQ
jgi:hypothetical protein